MASGNGTAASGVAGNTVIEIVDLHRVYRMGGDEVRALDGVSFTLERGGFVAVMGASGSGKSTLMNTLGCLDHPTSGVYRLDGIDVTRLDADARARIRNLKIGFVFQGFNLLARTSAIENVELPMVYAGIGTTERSVRAREALERVGLSSRMDHLPTELSGGQQQRVAIARALVTKPALLLADEPTGNLDSKTSEEIMDLFAELNVQSVTVLVVTHEPDIARYAPRNIVMKDGRILRDGPPPPKHTEPTGAFLPPLPSAGGGRACADGAGGGEGASP